MAALLDVVPRLTDTPPIGLSRLALLVAVVVIAAGLVQRRLSARRP